MMRYNERYQALNKCFEMGRSSTIDNSNIEIQFYNFDSNISGEEENKLLQYTDNKISENFSFKYPVFAPRNNKKYDKAILLLHGLNERSWNKYLTWAEYLCTHTQRPVIMFPIAYHINRGPMEWSNPRKMVDTLNNRKEKYCDDRSISYANVALSDRLSEHPSRFYLSGRQTLLDLSQLFEEIKDGKHPLFASGTDINIFTYSIGSFLAQISLMSNHNNLFEKSKLFMFCGGSIFSSMFGVSRSILDNHSFSKLQNYYINMFGNEDIAIWKQDNIFNSFSKMITPDKWKHERHTFFNSIKNRIKGVSLSKDVVIPYHGVQEAMGTETTTASIQLQDFPFSYSHENPFPHNEKDTTSLNKAFEGVFSDAVDFLVK